MIIIKSVTVAGPKGKRGTSIPGVVLNSLFKGLTTARGFKNIHALISATVLITILLPSPQVGLNCLSQIDYLLLSVATPAAKEEANKI